jgi:drug/metabolite transporter (DMT)-like permease
VRWVQELSPTQVTCLRMLLGGLFLGMAAWDSGERLRLQPSEYRRLIPIGLLAVAAALSFALYSHLGRRERGRIPLLTYACWVYLTAGAIMAPSPMISSSAA